MNAKKLVISGLAITLLNAPYIQHIDTAFAKGQPAVKTQSSLIKYDLSAKQAVQIAAVFAKSASYVQAGGSYKTGEYKTFSYKGETYRYLSAAIDTKKELLAYLQKSLTSAAAGQFIKSRGIIEYKGKLAQVEADGGSLLQWEKSAASLVKSEKSKKIYRLSVPLGETKEKQAFLAEYQYIEKIGWKLSKEPVRDHYAENIDSQAVYLAAEWAKATSYIQAGGANKPGEYKTFLYNGKTYRYLSGDIDTKKEMMGYLMNTMTNLAAEQFLKKSGIIEYKGKLAQPEADGGSLLQWNLAAPKLVKTEKNTKVYRMTVPVGETGEKAVFITEFQYVSSSGWRISKEPYRDLDIPGNINPAFIFFKYLLVDSKVSQDQFLDPASFNVEQFKTGIKKLEIRALNERARNRLQVEYTAAFYVELESGYKGSLKNGINQMYFTVQPAGEMQFKIAAAGDKPYLIKK
ncbi:hypothetical protein CVD28_18715 [Bacillus sp. M6-12]|uniref:DL-endopeptidase inhibitor IseA family protein n=1 Tax=Bacillus sp. M6-12 TaxID=2054166 RepID=UPI000C77BC60|nr:DL-endopeptidase inhibitor IseA family protein [Bacillus sp. M6-12]PLS16079.1 hypothetical protein CVD28_18715 [Bacillus sp. M6-12]